MGQGHERQPYGSANPLLAGVARDPRGRKTVSRGFILILVVLTVHLASPQLETVWSVFETPGDAARLLIGLLVCLWLVAQLFTAPRDADPYRTWFYLGLFVIPLTLISAIATR
jgi:hypothetical protein